MDGRQNKGMEISIETAKLRCGRQHSLAKISHLEKGCEDVIVDSVLMIYTCCEIRMVTLSGAWIRCGAGMDRRTGFSWLLKVLKIQPLMRKSNRLVRVLVCFLIPIITRSRGCYMPLSSPYAIPSFFLFLDPLCYFYRYIFIFIFSLLSTYLATF
jgi:hypothetical protein